MKNELLPQTSSEEEDRLIEKKPQLKTKKTYAEDETEMTPLVEQKQKVTEGTPITEKEYRRYRKKLAKETLRKLKYPNGKPENKVDSFRFEVLSKLGNRIGNINIDLDKAKPKEDTSESSSSDSEIENEIFKTQDKYMSDIKEKIDVYKIETMKKLSQGRFENIEVRPDDKAKKAKAAEKYWQKNKNSVDMKISKMHARFIKLESMATKNNILALFVGTCLFTVFVLPYLLYCWSVIDKHYFGWFHEPVTLFAKTTDQKMYYLSENIPFVTINDIYQEKEHYQKRLAQGHPTHYETFKEELYESILVAIGYR